MNGIMPIPFATVLRRKLDHTYEASGIVFVIHYDSRNSCYGIVIDGAKIPGSQGEGREKGILRRSPSTPRDHKQYHK